MFRDKDAFNCILDVFSESYLTIESLVRFEFLRDVFLPKQRELKELFIDNEVIFFPSAEHQQLFNDAKENALALSFIYAHKDVKSASFIDLMIAAKAVIHFPNAIIVTQNRKDFPAFLFDTVGVINYEEEKTRQISNYVIVSFNKENYKSAINSLEKVLG
jgi:predicted nucleic acid-binding protein